MPLEELQALSVKPVEIESTLILGLIKNADYEEKIKSLYIQNCIIFVDILRLQQVFDNVINNSYKYALDWR